MHHDVCIIIRRGKGGEIMTTFHRNDDGGVACNEETLVAFAFPEEQSWVCGVSNELTRLNRCVPVRDKAAQTTRKLTRNDRANRAAHAKKGAGWLIGAVEQKGSSSSSASSSWKFCTGGGRRDEPTTNARPAAIQVIYSQ